MSIPHCRLIRFFRGTLKAKRIRFQCDENVNVRVAELLREGGFDVTTSDASGLGAKGDERQLRRAAHERRILITNDAKDFPELARRLPHAGVLVCHGGGRFPEDVVRRCLEIAAESVSQIEVSPAPPHPVA